MFSAQDGSDPRSQTAQHLAVGIHQEPVALSILAIDVKGSQFSIPKLLNL
jgi:hypothetical protein